MKIDKITLCNLTSIEGEQTIDFTEEPLRSAGLFAITGDVGSGKSTILDAICLALYNRAPRFDNVERIPADDLIYYGLEYKFVTEYVVGRTSYEEMFRQLEIAIHQFAKRQMTWFRGMERRGYTIHWIDAAQSMDEKVEAIMSLMNE